MHTLGERQGGWEFWVGFPTWRWHRLSAENSLSLVRKCLDQAGAYFCSAPRVYRCQLIPVDIYRGQNVAWTTQCNKYAEENNLLWAIAVLTCVAYFHVNIRGISICSTIYLQLSILRPSAQTLKDTYGSKEWFGLFWESILYWSLLCIYMPVLLTEKPVSL